MKEIKKAPVLALILGILLILSSFATVFLAYQNMILRKEIAKVNVSTPLPTTSSAPAGCYYTSGICPQCPVGDTPCGPCQPPVLVCPSPQPTSQVDTSNWKTYTSSNGFSINYPSSYSYKEYTPGTPNIGYVESDVQTRTPYLVSTQTVKFEDQTKNDNLGIYVEYYQGAKEAKIETFAKNYIDSLVKLDENSETATRTSETVTYGGKNFLHMKITRAGPETNYYTDIWFYMDGSRSLVITPDSLGIASINTMLGSFNF